jgi:hypothetical protein
MTISQWLNVLSICGAGWLMLRAGTATRTIKLRVGVRCAACRRRTSGRRPCPCTRGKGT